MNPSNYQVKCHVSIVHLKMCSFGAVLLCWKSYGAKMYLITNSRWTISHSMYDISVLLVITVCFFPELYDTQIINYHHSLFSLTILFFRNAASKKKGQKGE